MSRDVSPRSPWRDPSALVHRYRTKQIYPQETGLQAKLAGYRNGQGQPLLWDLTPPAAPEALSKSKHRNILANIVLISNYVVNLPTQPLSPDDRQYGLVALSAALAVLEANTTFRLESERFREALFVVQQGVPVKTDFYT